jgi:hypothetical protein
LTNQRKVRYLYKQYLETLNINVLAKLVNRNKMRHLNIKYLNWLKFSIILSSSLLFWMVFMPVVHGNENNQGDTRVTPSVQPAKAKTVRQTKKTHPQTKKKANRKAKNKTAQSPKVTDLQMVQAKVGGSPLGVERPPPQEQTTPPAKAVDTPPVPQGPVTPATPATPPTPPATSPTPQTNPEEAKPGPIEAKVGVFITALYGFDLRNQSYEVTFWAWFLHNSKEYKPDTTEIVNAHSYNRDSSIAAPKGKLTWAQIRFTAKVAHNWDISNFPFDHQILQFFLEDSQLDESGIKYIADVHNSKVDPRVVLADWRIIDFNITAAPSTVQTTYGDPDLVNGSSTYSRVTVAITLERKGMRLFVNMFSALYIAFLLTSVAFFVPIENISARLSLATAAIFAAIGNKYVVDSMLPPTTSLTLVDKIQIATFLYIGIMVLVTVTYAHFGSQREALTRKLNKYGEVIFPFSYILLNIYWVYSAIQNH